MDLCTGGHSHVRASLKLFKQSPRNEKPSSDLVVQSPHLWREVRRYKNAKVDVRRWLEVFQDVGPYVVRVEGALVGSGLG